MSNLVDHARKELEILGEDPEFAESIVNAVRAFSEFGHSGASASIATDILLRVLRYENLTALTNDPDEWAYITKEQGGTTRALYQSRRNPAMFSNDGGATHYHVDTPGDIHSSVPFNERLSDEDDEDNPDVFQSYRDFVSSMTDIFKNPNVEGRHDPVNHPEHYTDHPSGIECIEVTRWMNFNLGNAVKYIWRADLKGADIEDLEKAVWYLQDEIARRDND